MTAEFIENIEDYLNGKISRDALEALAKEQGIDNLDQEIEWFEDSRVAVQAVGLRDQLKEILPQPEKKEAKIRSIRRNGWIIGIAASVLLIVVAYFGIGRNGQSDLYAQYEYIDPGLPVLMSQSQDHLLYDAMSYFGEENYSVAEEKLLQIQEEYTGSDTISYYLGASRLYQGKLELAKTNLSEVADNDSSRFKERAEWLLILGALKADDRSEAQQLLESLLEQSEHDFYAKGQDLQRDLSQ